MKRIVKDKGRYYPEYYHKSIFGKWFNKWKRYQTEELMLNGIFTSLDKTDVSFATLKKAEEYLKPEPKLEIIKQYTTCKK